MIKQVVGIVSVVALIILSGCVIEEPFSGNIVEDNQITGSTTKNVTDVAETDTAETTEDVQKEKPHEEEKEVTETKSKKPNSKKSDVPTKTVREGELVSFPNLQATDPDGDPIQYTFTSPLNENGEWLTKEGDAGQYEVIITASDGTNTAKQEVLLVVTPANYPPTINIANKITVKEGQTIKLEPEITDKDGDDVEIVYSGWMNNAVKETDYDDSGSYEVIISANDGKDKTEKEITIVIENKNRAPKLEKIKDVVITEGEEVLILPKATDEDDDEVSYSFSTPIDAKGFWKTKVGDAGEYTIKVTASDGVSKTEQDMKLIVEPLNKPPIIEIATRVEINEGETVKLQPKITEVEGEEYSVKYSGWMTSDTKKLSYQDSGEHVVVITAKDASGKESTKEVTIIVNDVNRPPTFDAGSFI